MNRKYQFCSVKHTDIRHMTKITVANGSGISLESKTTHFLRDATVCFGSALNNVITNRFGNKSVCNQKQIWINS